MIPIAGSMEGFFHAASDVRLSPCLLVRLCTVLVGAGESSRGHDSGMDYHRVGKRKDEQLRRWTCRSGAVIMYLDGAPAYVRAPRGSHSQRVLDPLSLGPRGARRPTGVGATASVVHPAPGIVVHRPVPAHLRADGAPAAGVVPSMKIAIRAGRRTPLSLVQSSPS